MTDKKKKEVIAPWKIIVTILLFFITSQLWYSSADIFIRQVINKGVEVKWFQMLITAVVGTIIFVGIINIFGFSLSRFEKEI